jgi:hypothetical protein
MDEATLMEKLARIEALFAGAATPGEKVAAENAKQRILERLRDYEREDPPAEYRFSTADVWSRKVLITLLRRYGISPYRYRGQRHTTVMATLPKSFVDETLWPEFQELSMTLHTYLSEVTERVLSEVIHQDNTEPAVVEEPRLLPFPAEDGRASLAPSSIPLAGSAQETRGPAAAEGPAKHVRKKRNRREG